MSMKLPVQALTMPAMREIFDLAEGPVWDPIRQQLIWVDITAGAVLTGTLRDDGIITLMGRYDFAGPVGAAAISAQGELLVAVDGDLLVCDRAGQCQPLISITPEDKSRRCNDGKPDPAGRFVIGTLRIDAGSDTETLVRLESDGNLTTLDEDLNLSNGLAWAPSGDRFYSVDTGNGRVYTRDYEPRSGTVGTRTVLFEIHDGSPDGLCTDEEGCLWLAIWGAGEVRRYSPDGELLTRVSVPAPHVSSVAFCGSDLRTLVITTARAGLDDSQLQLFPLSGSLFTLRPGVRGATIALWSGRPTAANVQSAAAA